MVGHTDLSGEWQTYYNGGSLCGVAYDPGNHQVVCSYCSGQGEHTNASMRKTFDASWEPCRVNRERTGVECAN